MLATACLSIAGPAQAQSREPSDEVIALLTELARENLPSARIEDGSNVPAETPQELAEPVIPRAMEIATIRRGELSGQMERCGLDWQNESFMPFMQALRAGGWHGKRMAYAGLLHGLSQGLTLRILRNSEGGCGAEEMAAMAREAAAPGGLR